MTTPRHTPVDLAAVSGDDELIEALRRGVGPAADEPADPAAELMLALLRDVDAEPDVLQLPERTAARPSLIGQGSGASTAPGSARARSVRASRRAAAGTAVVALSMLCVSGVAAAVTDRPGLAPYVGALQRGAAAIRDFTQSRQAPQAEAGRAPLATATPDPTSTRVGVVRPQVQEALEAVESMAQEGDTTAAQRALEALRLQLQSASPLMSPDEQQALEDAVASLDPTAAGTGVDGSTGGLSPTPGPSGTDDPSATPTPTPSPTPSDSPTAGVPDPTPSTQEPTPDSSDDPTSSSPPPTSSTAPSPSPSVDESPTTTPTEGQQPPVTQTATPETSAADPDTAAPDPETAAPAPETAAPETAAPETAAPETSEQPEQTAPA